jgi:hypothetical protein
VSPICWFSLTQKSRRLVDREGRSQPMTYHQIYEFQPSALQRLLDDVTAFGSEFTDCRYGRLHGA